MDCDEENNKEMAALNYRLRVQRIEEEKPVDLEWRSDVLYASPKAYPSKRKKSYLIQLIDNNVRTYDIAYISEKAEARKRYTEIKKDLKTMNKDDFEECYGVKSKIAQSFDAEDDTEMQKSQRIDPLLNEAILFTGEVRVRGDKKEMKTS